MKLQNIVMTCALILAAAGAFASKGIANRLPTIYGKIGGQCTALCTTTVSNVCLKGDDDGLYYTVGPCQTQYTGARYQIPGT